MFLWFEFSCVNRLDISINLSVGSRDRVRGGGTAPSSVLLFFLLQTSFNAHAGCTGKCFCTTRNNFTHRLPLDEGNRVSGETYGLIRVAENMMNDLDRRIFYSRLLKKNFAVEIIPK